MCIICPINFVLCNLRTFVLFSIYDLLTAVRSVSSRTWSPVNLVRLVHIHWRCQWTASRDDRWSGQLPSAPQCGSRPCRVSPPSQYTDRWSCAVRTMYSYIHFVPMFERQWVFHVSLGDYAFVYPKGRRWHGSVTLGCISRVGATRRPSVLYHPISPFGFSERCFCFQFTLFSSLFQFIRGGMANFAIFLFLGSTTAGCSHPSERGRSVQKDQGAGGWIFVLSTLI